MARQQHQNTSFDTFRLAHALVTAIAFLFFAIGGIWLRFSKSKHAVRNHAYFQIFNTALMIVGFGFGVYLCQTNPRWWKLAHSILGTIVVALFAVPLVLGYLQHNYFHTHQKRSWRGIWHFWTARVLILLGIVDGYVVGPSGYYATIGGLAIIFYLVALGVLAWKERRFRRKAPAARNTGVELR